MSATPVADSGIEQIVAAFENATIEAADFDHEAHLLVGWWYLQERSVLDALSRFTGALRRLTRKLGMPSKYHDLSRVVNFLEDLVGEERVTLLVIVREDRARGEELQRIGFRGKDSAEVNDLDA